jgi:hypothetical protein
VDIVFSVDALIDYLQDSKWEVDVFFWKEVTAWTCYLPFLVLFPCRLSNSQQLKHGDTFFGKRMHMMCSIVMSNVLSREDIHIVSNIE